MMNSRHGISISIVPVLAALAGCPAAGPAGTGGAGGAAVASSSSASSSSSSNASSSSSSASSSSSGGMFPCSPLDPICNVVASPCIALVDNAALNPFTLRVSQLDLTKPVALTAPLIKSVLGSGISMNLAPCNLGGTGTFNVLLSFDTTNNTLTLGGAHPSMAPAQGYQFVNGMYLGLTVAPVTTSMTLNAGNFTSAAIASVNLPLYLQIADIAPGIIFPIRQAKVAGTLSAGNNCIGKYNADKLDPQTGCTGTDANPAFTGAGTLDGHMLLEEADTIIINALGQSLCVLLSGDAATYGDGGNPMKCKRDATSQIVFHGDWCHANDMPAGAVCFDASRIQGNLAASAVTLLP